ncbi:MAG: hypothetical protein CMG55_07210 [Candidatus Marinimicrobia bacterium]|nr:hypothetical protein [Candidatus Neomarinimicrobiota bacterium]
MSNKSHILSFLFIYLVGISLLKSQTIEFTPGNEGTSYLKYNIAMSTASTAAGVGGFTASCTAGCNDDNTYRIRVSFDGGTNWYSSFSSMTATTGGATSNGRFFSDGGLAQISVSHEVLAGLSAWPGDDNAQGIKLQVYESETSTYYPTSPVSWTLDLTRPTISSATIASDNSTNTAFATTDDVVTIGITASEDLINAGSYVFTGNMAGLSFNTRSGSDATQWEFYNTVSTHAEQVVTYSIVYYDANYNVGASNLTTTTDGSTVTVDKSSPELTVTIASNNDVSSLAKHGDIVTVSIASNETLNGAPTVQISSNTSPTVNPSTASTNYTATHTLNQASDPQTAVTFSISNVLDRAGNTVSAITNTSDASSVTFDYTAPLLDAVASSSNNSLTSERAKADDVVTVSFTTREAVQTPVVLIAGESAVEANANGDKVTWVATKTMDAEDSDGEIDFTINFTDLAGNTGTEVTKTGITSGSAVIFDNTPPTLASLTVSSSNSTNSNYGIEDDIISLTIIAQEDLQGDASKNPYGITAATIAGRSVDGNGNEIISKVDARNWSAQVQLNGSEASAPVSYSFTMTDLTGNQTAIDENVSSVTIDNDIPALNSVSIASVSTDNDDYAKSGDVIKVSFTSNENLSSSNPPTGTIALTSSSVSMTSGDADNRTIFESTLTTSNSTTEGNVAFTLDIEDYAGNSATVAATTDGSSVIFDRTTPLMSYVRMSSSGSDTNYAKVGDLVTLSMKATDKLKTAPTVTVFSNAATVSGGNTDSIWTAVYTMPAGLADGATPFTLDFTDMAGNNGAQITSTANDAGSHVIYDEVVPTLSTASISSNNSNGATIAKVGDIITLNIVSEEPIQTPSIEIAGRSGSGAASLSNSTSGLSVYTSTYTMLDGDTEGAVTFSIDFSDLASNAGTQVTALINDADGSGITFDKTPPYFNETTAQGAGAITISSNNSDNTVAVLGDVVTLSLTSTEAIKAGSDPTVTINGNNATVTRNSTTTFTATYTMSSTDGSSNIDAIPFVISDYEDVAGNAGATVNNSTTDGTSIKYDPIRPTLSNIVMVSDNSNSAYAKQGDEIQLTFESSETINTPTITMLGSADGVTVAANGTNAWKATRTIIGGDAETGVAFTVSFSDPAGNTGSNGSGGAVVTATSSGSVVMVDRTGPTITTVDIATDNDLPQYAVPADIVTLTIIANEAIQTPTVTIMQNSAPTVEDVDGFDNKKWTATHTAGNAETVGTVPFSIDALDLAGNANTAGQITSIDGLNDSDGSNVTYDNTAPTLSNITFTSNNTINSAYAKNNDIVTVEFEADEQLLESTVSVIINAAGTADVATVNKSSDWDGVTEGWRAAFVVPSTYQANLGYGNIIPYQIDYKDIFTVPGTQITQGVTGNVIYDGDPPDLDALTISSDNDNSSVLATVGDVITVSFTGDEPLAITTDPSVVVPVLTIGGNVVTTVAEPGTNDLQWTGSYTMTNLDTEGELALVLDYKDYAGNSGPTKTNSDLTSGSAITFDKTAPTLTAVSILSNNKYDTSKAKVGDQITISFTGSHPLRTSPVVVINPASDNITATVTQGDDNTLWSATYTLLEADTEGDISFTIDYQDLATNAGTQVTDVTDGSAVAFDKTATNISALTIALDGASDTGTSSSDRLTNDTTPTFTVTGLTAATAISDTLILFVDGARVDSVEVTGNTASLTSTAIAHSINTYTITIKSRDLAGNVSAMSASSVATPDNSIEIRMDTQAPAVGDAFDLIPDHDTGVLDTDNITSVTKPTMMVAGLAPGERNLIAIYYDAVALDVTDAFLANHRMATAITDSVKLTTAMAEDVYSFSYVVIDSAGNESNMSVSTDVTIDLTAPSVPSAPDLLDDGGSDGDDEYDTGTSNTDNVTNLETVEFQVSGLSTNDDKIFIIDTKGTVSTADDDTSASADIDASVVNLTINSLATTSYAAMVSDLAGNASILSDLIDITFDNTPTDIDGNKVNEDDDYDDAGEFPPVLVDLIGTSDTGLDTTDNITNLVRPTFRVKNLVTSSALTDSIFLYATVAGNNDNLVAKGVVNGNSEDLVINDVNELGENNYQIKLRTKDYAGNFSDYTTEFTITVDTSSFVIAEPPDLIIEDDSGVSRSDNITNVRNPRLNFKSLDVSADSLELYITTSSGATSFSVGGRKDQNRFSDSLQVPTNLTAGVYSFAYKVIDLAGNESALSNGLSVTVDYTSPNDPSDLDLAAADDKGPSDSDNLTNASSMSITSSGLVTGEYGFLYLWNDANSDNVIDVGEGTKIDSALLVADDGGIATFTISNSVDDTLDYYVTAQDVAGNTSSIVDAPRLQVQVDLTPPSVSDLAIVLDPGSDTGISGDNAGFNTAPTFTVTDTIANLTPTDSVILYYALTSSSQNPGIGLNGAPKRFAALPIDAASESLTGVADAVFDENGGGVDDGTYAITAKLRDYAGNLSSASSGIVYRLDTTAPQTYPDPSGSFTAPDLLDDDDKGYSNTDNITNIQNPRFVISDLHFLKKDKVIVYAKKGFTTSVVDSGNVPENQTTLTIAVPWVDDGNGIVDDGEGALDEGLWTITYTVTDSAGNVTEASPELSMEIDATAPTALGTPDLIAEYDTGESDSDGLINLPIIRIDQTDTIPGFKWVLYSVIDDGDGVYNESLDTLFVEEDSQLFPGGSGPDGLDSDNDGSPDGARSVSVDLAVSDTTHHFFAVHEDIAGNQSANSNALTISVDSTPPNCSITYDDPDNDGTPDNLVKYADGSVQATLTFDKSMDDQDSPPRIVLNYPDLLWTPDTVLINKVGNSDTDWNYSIPLNQSGMDTLNGLLNIEVLAADRYGNPVSTVTGNAEIRIDNLAPVFSNIVPGSGSYNNADSLASFSWTLDEPNAITTIVEASVTFNNLDDNTSYSTSLDPADLVEGDRFPTPLPGWTSDPYFIPHTEGLYEVIFSSLDSAGNVGSDTLLNFTYDTLRPSAQVSFSRLHASNDTTVTVYAVFSEDMLSDSASGQRPIFNAQYYPYAGNTVSGEMQLHNIPEEYIEANGVEGWQSPEDYTDYNGNGVYDATGDLFTFRYTFVVDGQDNETGLLDSINITNAKDLADNTVNTIVVDSLLLVNNQVGQVQFSYENITNPSLTNVGIAGDTVKVTATSNEALVSDPSPTINMYYNTASGVALGDSSLGVNLSEPNADNGITWVYQIVLASGLDNDGQVLFEFNGKDLANNVLTENQIINNQLFVVDNLPPTYYETDSVSVIGGNVVKGWVTGNTTGIGVTVPIENAANEAAPPTDTTLQNGLIEIQFYNTNRGLGWVTIGENDTLDEYGGLQTFTRSIEDLYAVMDTNLTASTGLQPGDLLAVRVKVHDKHANVTAFGTSSDSLRFDPSGPVPGQIVSGVFGITSDASTDTIYSNDLVEIAWTPFIESDPQESGLKEYQLTILKRDSTTAGQLVVFEDTLLTDPPDTSFSHELFLTHGTRYVAQIVGIDTAGNYSTVLSSDTLLRLNTAPLITQISSVTQYPEDTLWVDSVEIVDPDLSVMQGDSHIFSISTDISTDPIESGESRGGAANYVLLPYQAVRQDDFYTGCEITVTISGQDQIRKIIEYEGATRRAIVSDASSPELEFSPPPADNDLFSIKLSTPEIDSLTGVMSWIPRQSNADHGPFNVTVSVTDNYNFNHSDVFQFTVPQKNDPPEGFLRDSLSLGTGIAEWQEDSSYTLILSDYFVDVDNDITDPNGGTVGENENDWNQAGGLDWVVIIRDTAELDEDFPLGTVVAGPGASNEFVAKVSRQYLGFDPNKNFTSKNFTRERTQQINRVSNNPLISLQWSYGSSQNSETLDQTIVTFVSDSNYYGSAHEIVFIGKDQGDSLVRDSLIANILPKNDPPIFHTELPDTFLYENDSLWLKFGPFINDVDNEELTFTVSAITNEDKVSITPSESVSSSVEDSILFKPSLLWSNQAEIQVIVDDGQAADTSLFILDVERVLRPHFSVSVTQNNAFNKYFQIFVIDTVSKATFVSMDVANSNRNLDTIADFTYSANVYMEASGNYPIDVSSIAAVGDTTIREYFSLAAGRSAFRWTGRSYDGKFSVAGDPGAVTYDQSLLIIDSTLFEPSFHDRASYVLGNEDFHFNQPIEVRLADDRDNVAIYRRKNGAIWEELPSINKDGEIFTLSEKAGYFKLGRKTIIVPEQTNIHQNYPNPFNPRTTIIYDIGLLDGLKQNVSIRVYNLLGQHVTTLIENKDQIGQFTIQWDGTNKFGEQMSSGVYFIQLATKTGIIKNKKMMLLK